MNDQSKSRKLGPAGRITVFAGLMVVVLAGAAFLGSKIDPAVDPSPAHADAGGTGHGAGHPETGGGSLPGLAVADGGYRLETARTTFPAGESAHLEFAIVDEQGETVTDFDETHERRMHLILVRSDFEGFQHLHPKQLADGSWAAVSAPLQPGTFRMFTDFSVDNRPTTLATDLFVSGEFAPKPLAAVSPVADAGDQYQVRIASSPAGPGQAGPVEFTVYRNGEAVNDLQPYLGADGHLVALRQGDLAFLHTHPEGIPGGPGPISFEVEYPSAGNYRLFLQFRHQGTVRTAEFTRIVGAPDHNEHSAEGTDH